MFLSNLNCHLHQSPFQIDNIAKNKFSFNKKLWISVIAINCLACATIKALYQKDWLTASICLGGICLQVALFILYPSIYQKRAELKPKKPVQEIPLNCVKAQPNYQPKSDENSYAFRARIFQETLASCQHGYLTPNQVFVKMDHSPMLEGTCSYSQLDPLKSMTKCYQTQFSVITEDTFQVLLQRKKEGAHPVGINMANLYHPGGGVDQGCPAQEEALCRRSNHILGLKTQQYPISEMGGIYCPAVQIFREDEDHGYSFMDQPQEVALVAVAAYDLRENSIDRSHLGLPMKDALSEIDLLKCNKYIESSKNKIRNMLRMMALKGHTQIVLGALGCGAFQTPPTLMARLFEEIFNEPELKGRFERVDFAILKIFPNDQQNVDAFQQISEKLNKKI